MKAYLSIILVGMVWSFSGCLQSQSSDDPTVASKSWYEKAGIEARNYPDTTVHLFIDTLPAFCSWKIYRSVGGTESFLRRYWGQCFYDSCISIDEAVAYRIELLDENEAVAQERHISSIPWSTGVHTGLFYPDSNTRLCEGEPISVRWNPQSFPTGTVGFSVRQTDDFDGIAPGAVLNSLTENGMAKISYQYLVYFRGGKANMVLSVGSGSIYTYTQVAAAYVASSSELITEPAFKDSLQIGLPTAVTWVTSAFSNDITVMLIDESKFNVWTIGKYKNTGELAWVVPNITPDIVYYLRFQEDTTYKVYYSYPFVICK